MSNKRKNTTDKPHSKSSKKAKPLQEEQKSSSAQKRALKHERQSRRRHADDVREAKEIWNKLRLKNNGPDEVKALMKQLMELIQGKVCQVALQHDASRVVQAAIQFGTAEQRKQIVQELCTQGSLAELSKVQYAHFVVLKLIKYCERDNDSVRAIVKALKGSIPKLAVHAVGARVVEMVFGNFSAKSTAALKQEFYGPHFSLFGAGDTSDGSRQHTLVSNLKSQPDKKEVTLEFVLNILKKGLDKGLYGFSYFQELFAEYVEVASPKDIRSIGSSVVDHSIHMLSTRPGTCVVAACASYGTAKDRKRIMKSLKGYTRSSLLHRDAYLAILRLVQVTDDTVSVHKSILAEITTTARQTDDAKEDENDKSSLLELALNENAAKLFLILLVSEEKCQQKYLDPFECTVLKPNPTITEGGQEVPTSKKNPETRRKELVLYLQKPLIQMCVEHAAELIKSLPGARVLKEVYAAYRPQNLVEAVLDACKESLEQDSGAIFEDRVGHHSLKNMILCDTAENRSQSEAAFATAFFQRFQKSLDAIGSSNRGAFVLTALFKVDSIRSSVHGEIKKLKKSLQRRKKDESKTTAGFDALLKELN